MRCEEVEGRQGSLSGNGFQLEADYIDLSLLRTSFNSYGASWGMGTPPRHRKRRLRNRHRIKLRLSNGL